jgi:hypothetical protein
MHWSALLLVLAMVLSPVSRAGERSLSPAAGEAAKIVQAMMSELITWIAVKTGMRPCVPPALRYATSEEIADRWYGDDVSGGQIIKVRALYEYPSATVYVSRDFDWSNLLDRSILLHELVHHVQHRNAVKFQCHAAAEPQAYELQATWLEEQGEDEPWGLMNVDRFTVYALSACPE